jgi:hypothetical protein
VGTWNADTSTCTAANIRNDNARANTTALTGTSTTGSFCVNIYDSGNLPSTWTVAYTLQVTHP